MFSSSSAGIGSGSLHGLRRNDVLQPSSLGFMKEISDEEVAKQSEISTVIADNLKILKTIPLPHHIQFEEISKILETITENEMKEDPLHKLSLKLSQYANNFFQKMESYFNGIFDFDKRLKERRLSGVFALSKEYLMSDLPSSYIKTLSSSFLTEIKFLDLFDYIIRRERLRLRVVRNNYIKFKRICDAHNSWIDNLDSLHDSMIDSRTKLLWYVDIQNCGTTEEAFEVKELRKSNVDEETFFGYLIDLQKRTEQFRKTLGSMNKEVFRINLERKDSTVNLLCNVVEIINR